MLVRSCKILALLEGNSPLDSVGTPRTARAAHERSARGISDPGTGQIPNHLVRFAMRKALSQADNTHPPYGAAIPDSNSHIPAIGAFIPLNGNRNSDNDNRAPASDNPIPVNDKKSTLITGRAFRKFSELPCFWRHVSRFLKQKSTSRH